MPEFSHIFLVLFSHSNAIYGNMVIFWYYSGINGNINGIYGNNMVFPLQFSHSLLPLALPLQTCKATEICTWWIRHPANPVRTPGTLKAGIFGKAGLLLWKKIYQLWNKSPTLLKKLGILLYGKSRFIAD